MECGSDSVGFKRNDMKTIFICFLFIFLLIGCDSDSVEGMIVVSRGVEIEVIDKDGNDLLDPLTESENAIDEIRIFYLRSGKYEEIHHYENVRNTIAYTSKFELEQIDPSLWDKNASLRYRIYLEGDYDKSKAETSLVIEWNKNTCDTMRYVWPRSTKYSGYMQIVNQIYMNDKLLWTVDDKWYITLVK